jgi:nitrogen fixation protein FixH
MASLAKKKTEFTGFHMLMIMLAFFGTIISVNFTMAYLASSSWSGLVVENTYVASQQFNGKAAEARRLAATGITGSLTLGKDSIRYQLSHPQTGPIEADEVEVVFKRPVGEHQDFPLRLTETENGVFTGTHSVAKGQWIIDITSKLKGSIVYHEAVRRLVAGE